jgi:DNA-binding NtrC family response regulator
LLATTFLQEFGHAAGGRRVELTREALEALLRYEWPGNVRELRNVLERATIVCEDGVIHREDLSLWPVPPPIVDTTELEVIERRAIERVMHEVEGNKAKASRQLGITRTQLYMRLRKYGIELS